LAEVASRIDVDVWSTTGTALGEGDDEHPDAIRTVNNTAPSDADGLTKRLP